MKNHILHGVFVVFALAAVLVPGTSASAQDTTQTQCTPASVEISGLDMRTDTGTVTLRDLSGEAIPEGWKLEIQRTETIEISADGRAQTRIPFRTKGDNQRVALALIDASGNERDVFALSLVDTDGDQPAPATESQEDETQTSSTDESENPSGSEDSETDETPPSSNTQTGALHINELLADPVDGGDEWVEIYNPNDFPVDVTGWTLQDAAGANTNLGDKLITAGGYMTIKNPNGNLNNSGDMLILYDAEEEIIDNVSYGNAGYDIPRDGDTLARFGDSFAITDNPTRGAANLPASETNDKDEETNQEQNQSNTPQDNTPNTDNSESAPDHNSETKNGDNTSGETLTHNAEASDEEMTSRQALQLSEILPDPTGDDRQNEFIEIQNTGTSSVPLNGVVVRDASGKTYTFSDRQIDPGAFFALEREDSLIALNNAGDTVELISPSDKIIGSFTYEDSTTGHAHIQTENGWQPTTHPTLGEQNILQQPETEPADNDAETEQSTDTAESTASLFTPVTVSEAKRAADDEKVRVAGTVTVTPGIFGKQIFYLQDDTGGIQIYKHDAAFGALSAGDGVDVKGIVRSSRGEKRVLVRGELGTTEENPNITPQSITPKGLDDSVIGELIKTEGTVMARNGNKITLQNHDTNLIVRLSDNDTIDPDIFERGSEVVVTGIYTATNDKRYLRPRTPDDVHIKQVQNEAEDTTVAMAGTTGNMQKEERFKRNAKLLIGATTVGLSALLIKSNQDYFKRLYDNHFLDLKPTKTG